MAEDFQVHVVAFGEHVFQRNVVDQVLLEVLRRVGVGAELAADDRPHAVVEEVFREPVGVVGALAVGVVFAVGVDAEGEVHALEVVLRPLVQLLLDERVERILGADFRGRSRAGVGVVDQQVHRLVGALLGRQRVQLVLHGEVLGGRQAETDRQVVERVADVDRDVEIHRPGVLPVGGDVGPHGLDGRDVEGRVGDVADPFDVAVRRDFEDFLRDDGRVVAHASARKHVFARQADVAQRVHRVGEVAAAPEVDPVAAVGREVHGGLHVVVDVDVYKHVHAPDAYLLRRVVRGLGVQLAERDERHDILRAFLHVHRRVLHDVVDVRAAQQGDVAADDEFVHGTFGRGAEVEIGLAVDRRAGLAGHVDELEIRGPQREVGRHAPEVGEADLAADGQRAFVRGVNRVVVEQDAAAGDADRVRGEAERRADHRDADIGPGEPHASVEFRPLGSAARVDPGLKAARKAEQVGGQEDVGPLQGEARDGHRQVERAFAPLAAVSLHGQHFGSVERQARVGEVSPVLFVEQPEVDAAETLFVVGQLRHRDPAPEGEAVRREIQRQVRAQHAVDGRGRGEQLQRRTDVQSGDVEADVVVVTAARGRADREPLVAVGHVEVGLHALVEAVCEVVAAIDRPRLETEQRVGRRHARADQAVGPRHVQPEAESFAAGAVALVKVRLPGVPHEVAVQSGPGDVVEVLGGVRQPEGVFQPFPVLADVGRHGVEDHVPVGQSLRAQADRNGQRVAVRPFGVQRVEGDLPGFQQAVEDVVGTRRDPQGEVGERGFQLLHVDALRVDLSGQRPGAPGQRRDQRVSGLGRGERQRQVAGSRFGPGCGRVGVQRDARRADAVRPVFVPDFDAVQRDAGGIGALSGGGCGGIEGERSADRLRADAQRGQVEPEDAAREADALFAFGQRSGDGQQQPERLVAVGDPSRKTLAVEFCVEFDAPEVASAELRAADLRPEARPGPGQQRVEARAAGLQGQVDDPQRIGREETVEREAVGPDRGVVTLFAGVEPPLHGKFTAVGRECRSRRERPPVRPGGAAEPDQGRNRHAPPQGRVGEQRLEERKVPEVALEAGRRLHPVGVEQVFRRGVGLEVEVSGRRDFQLRLSDVAQSSRRGERQPDGPVVQHGRDRLRGEVFQVLRVQVGRKDGVERRSRLQFQDSGPGGELRPDSGEGGLQVEAGEDDARGVHAETSGQVADRKPAAFGERRPADLQRDVGAPVVHRINREVERREGDERRVEPRGGTVAQPAVFDAVAGQRDAADPDGPWCRRFGRPGGSPAFRFGRSGEVGVGAPVEQDAFHGDLLAVQQHPAGVDAPVGQADGEFGDRRGGPHPEGEARDRDSVESHRPRQGGGALLFLGGSRFGQVQPDVRVGENEPGDAGRVGRKIGADGFEGQLSRSQAQVHARQGVLVVGGDAFQREAPDGDLFADQRPQGGVEREPSAAEERVRPVGQQGVVHRQPQRKGEADAFDGDLHAERPGGVGDGPSPGQVLNGRNIEQRRDQQQDEENDEQRPERMFENFFQHLWKQRVSESGKRQAVGLSFARACLRQSGKIAANYKKNDDPSMERAKTNGPIRGISRRSVRSVRPETEEAPGTAGTVGTMGWEAGAAVAPGGSGKRKTSGLVAGRFGAVRCH